MKFNWFRRRNREAELDAEIRTHLDAAIRDRLARGEAPDEARANARDFEQHGERAVSSEPGIADHRRAQSGDHGHQS